MFRFLRQEVNGFTVMEILVTLVISGIVVLTAFEFYNVFNRLLLKKNNSLQGGKEMLQFYNAFVNDADSAIFLTSSDAGLTMTISQKELIQYSFLDGYVVRAIGAVSDTFHVKVMNIRAVKDLTTGFDKNISFEIEKDNETIPVLFEKRYTNDVLMNSTIFPNK